MIKPNTGFGRPTKSNHTSRRASAADSAITCNAAYRRRRRRSEYSKNCCGEAGT